MFTGKVAVITGGARGIGRAIADGNGMCVAGWPERAARRYESLQKQTAAGHIETRLKEYTGR